MKDLKELYRKNIKNAVYANFKEDKEVSREEVFYKSMREYMVLKRLESWLRNYLKLYTSHVLLVLRRFPQGMTTSRWQSTYQLWRQGNLELTI